MTYDAGNPQSHEEGAAENKSGHRKFATYDVPDWVRHPLKGQPNKVAILFPGEQNHAVGMLKDVRRKPAVRAMMEAASLALGYDVEALMRDGPALKMAQPGFSQHLVYVADCAAFEVLRERFPNVAENPQAVAGFGVGEYAALYAAGVVTFSQGLEIVKVRAEAMQALADEVEMEALQVRACSQDKVEKHMKTARRLDEGGDDEPEVYIARYWCPDGVVCAGRRSTVLKLQELLEKEPGAEVRLLPDSVPAGHTPMAQVAAARVAAALDRIIPAMHPPRCELYLNQTGWRVPRGRSPLTFAEALKSQLAEPIQWQSCVTQMLNWGVREFFECGPSRSLKFAMGFFEHFIEAPMETLRPADFTVNVSV